MEKVEKMEKRFPDDEVFNELDISYRGFYEYRSFLKEKGILKTRERLNMEHVEALKEIIKLKKETNMTYREVFEYVISRRFNQNTNEDNKSEIQMLSEQLKEGTFYICKEGLDLNNKVVETKVIDNELIEIKLENGRLDIVKNCITKIRRPKNIRKNFAWCYLVRNEEGEKLGYIGLSMPSQKELINAALNVIGKKGTCDLSEIYDGIIQDLKLNNEIRYIPSETNSSKYENRVRWAVQYLKDNYELIDNTGNRGEYTLTDLGKVFYNNKNINATDFEDIIEANYINQLINNNGEVIK